MDTKKKTLLFLIIFLVWTVLFVLISKTLLPQNNTNIQNTNKRAFCLPYERNITSNTKDGIVVEDVSIYNLLCWCKVKNSMNLVDGFDFKSNTPHNETCNKQCEKLCFGENDSTVGKCIKISEANIVSGINYEAQPFKYILGCKCNDFTLDGFRYTSNTVTDSSCDTKCNNMCKSLLND
ncbi:MAG: hypothetical protein MJ156_00140 [Alphaproteobacteria bacterium]|nr:hypothetical protein [Alphaproteobacteria bacterium]